MSGTRALLAAVIVVAVALAGCSQSDGPIPTPTDEQPNKVHDIGRDLQNIAGGDATAKKDLIEDLNGLDSVDRPPALVDQLGTSVADAVKNKPLPDQVAQTAAQQLFVVTTARQLSQKQIDQASTDLKSTITKVGGDAVKTDRVSAAAKALLTTMTLNRRRWYQVF